MTYVIGINKPEYNFSAIICDSLVTFTNSRGVSIASSPYALKSGLLFKGCIFGITGENIEAIQEFLINFKKKVNQNESVQENLANFISYISEYSLDECGKFSILFSIRNPNPTFYVLNNNTKRLTKVNDTLITLGSGKGLDRYVFEITHILDTKFIQILTRHKTKIVYYPYFVCQFLMEQSLGEERYELEKNGFGGFYNYCYQYNDKDQRPFPAIFVIVYKTKKNLLKFYPYRTSFVKGLFLVEDFVSKKGVIVTSPIEKIGLTNNDVMNLAPKIIEESNKQGLYCFCGFVFYKPEYRGYYKMHFSSPQGKKIIDKNGLIDESVIKDINQKMIN